MLDFATFACAVQLPWHASCALLQFWCRFQFEHTPEVVAKQCNCSICNMKGIINVHVAPHRFELLSGADSITEYQV